MVDRGNRPYEVERMLLALRNAINKQLSGAGLVKQRHDACWDELIEFAVETSQAGEYSDAVIVYGVLAMWYQGEIGNKDTDYLAGIWRVQAERSRVT